MLPSPRTSNWSSQGCTEAHTGPATGCRPAKMRAAGRHQAPPLSLPAAFLIHNPPPTRPLTHHTLHNPPQPRLLFPVSYIRSQWFSPEMPEWDMEKYRFYLDLPGDFWESGTLLRYLREREVQVRQLGRTRVRVLASALQLSAHLRRGLLSQQEGHRKGLQALDCVPYRTSLCHVAPADPNCC